jgi:DNA-binding NarL/FixJ family response regulator
MRILLVEDDWVQEESMREAIHDAFPNASIESLCTELEFRNELDRIVADPPDLVILDIMIRWTDPSPDLDESVLPLELSRQDAGLRCHQLLAERSPHTRTLLYSILDKEDIGREFPSNVDYLQKGDGLDRLINKIARMLNAPRRVPQ